MPSNPPTVIDLDAEVTEICGIILADAGLFLRALDDGDPTKPITPVVRRGLRKGALAVGWTLQDPSTLQDGDIVGMSGFALQRLKEEAELYAFQQCLAGWYRVNQKFQEPLEQDVARGGWANEEKQDVKARVSELKSDLSEPYREPTDPAVVANRSDDADGNRNPFGHGCYPGSNRWGGYPC